MTRIDKQMLKQYIRIHRNRTIRKVKSFNILGDIVFVVYDDGKDIRELNILVSDLYDFNNG